METTMVRAKRLTIGLAMIALVLLMLGSPANAYGADGEGLTTTDFAIQEGEVTYSYNATLYAADYPGVYKTNPIAANNATMAEAPTIGIPSIADKTLATAPTTESPAIICGSAFPWGPYGDKEPKENAREFTDVSTGRCAPYSYFKYDVTSVTEADGVTPKKGPDGEPIKKLTGFDGTYVIVRIDLSDLWNSIPEEKRGTSYLHVSQEKNNALLVAVGMDTITGNPDRDQWGNCSFSNLFTPEGQTTVQYHRKTASYKLSEMYDPAGSLETDKPYFDVILFSTAAIVAGADAQKEGALTGDVELSFYIDETADYNKELNWDPQSTDTTLPARCFAKFFDEAKAKEAGTTISHYLVKGSDLALEAMVDNSDNTGTQTTYWSLAKSIQEPYYNQEIDKSATDEGCGRTITLMSEVPVIGNMALVGPNATELKKRTLNVNSFDIQVANNTSSGEDQYTSGFTMENAWLKIADFSNTTGAELAIGNNATMSIKTGGKLIIDKTCQLEIEWDGATVAPPAEGETAPAADILNNGLLDLQAGGEVQNDGIITIEGTEGKPYQPDASGTAPESAKGHGELTICEGATLTNNGCLMANGALYVQGTLVNNGKYKDTIVSNDPDKGTFTYHCGIQSTWKDDVTQSNIIYGGVYVGMDNTWMKAYESGMLENNGDLVLCPGELVNMATIKNAKDAAIYVCATDKATIPIEPTPENPTVITKVVMFDDPKGSYIWNWSTIENEGAIQPGEVTVEENGSLGTLAIPGRFADYFQLNLPDEGRITGQGSYYKHDLSRAVIELRRKSQSYNSVVYDGSPQIFDVVAAIGGSLYAGEKCFKVTILNEAGKEIKESQVKNAGKYRYVLEGTELFTGTGTKQLTIKKAANTMSVKGKTAKVKQADLKKKAQTIKRADAFTVSKAKGTKSYELISVKKAKFKKYFKVAPKTGNITVKRGLAKGTYKVKVRVTAAGTANYKAAKKSVTCTIKVV
jgi:hypothetical protein